MLKIKCDRCKAELQSKDLAAAVYIAPGAFAQGDKRGAVVQYELCPSCAASVMDVIEKKVDYIV